MLHFILSVLLTVLAVAANDCADCVRAPSLLQRSGQALAAVQLGSDATACTTSATRNCEPIHEITQHILSQPPSSQLSMLRKYSEPLLAQLDVSNRSNHTAIIKNGTADLHGLITGLLDELHSTLKGYQVSLNASVDAFHACADLLHIDQGLVTTQANAMGQTAQLQSELNSSVKVVGDFGSTAETAAAAATALKAEVDSKAFAFTSKLASIEAALGAEMVANQSLNDAQAAAEKLFSTCQCTTHANFNNVKDTVNTSRLVVEDNIELLKYLNCTLGLGQRSDSCVLQSAHQSSINFHTGVVVLTADTICEDSSNSGSGLGSSSGPPLLQIDAWTNFASACSCTQRQNDACNYKCNGLQEKGGQTCFTFTNLGTMTWKECVKKASALGASLCSEDYTEGDGWGGHRSGDTAERFERFYSPKFDLITSQHSCVVGKHDRVTSFDRTLCSQKAEYDGDTWWYHDAGVKYYDECVYLASSAGATIIDPVTIGMGDSTDYWTFTKHSGNVYTYYTGIDTISSHNVGCQSRGDAHKCMFGFMEV
mmetsp:Transcript_63354/g.151403  ORF Transcript_63354/g.151403 Transcript_63354/m.151403 type:complete len:539 (+) Transcript_63354:65-1681(+)